MSNPILKFLINRNSCPKLDDPGPSQQEISDILQVAMRAPDHAWLRPWRFITIEGERRNAFGEVLADCLIKRNPQADQAAVEKARAAPLRAPLLIAVAVAISEHPKVPAVEQRLSAACAAHGILLAAEALGYGGIWRTGEACFDSAVMAAIGLASNEELVGFIYLGSRQGASKKLPSLDVDDFLTDW